MAWDMGDLPRGSERNPLAAHTLTIPVTLDEMPVAYDFEARPAVLRFRSGMGTLVIIRLEMDDYEKLLERQNEVIGTMRDDALK